MFLIFDRWCQTEIHKRHYYVQRLCLKCRTVSTARSITSTGSSKTERRTPPHYPLVVRDNHSLRNPNADCAVSLYSATHHRRMRVQHTQLTLKHGIEITFPLELNAHTPGKQVYMYSNY